jgi:ribose 1,5-bisphosphokinase PhnN
LIKRKGILFVLSGPSGVGKGTVKEALLKTMDDICLSVSATTRKPRSNEVHMPLLLQDFDDPVFVMGSYPGKYPAI